MVELIVGKEGKGKTKQLLERVNTEIKTASGNIVFLDRNDKHMFELNNNNVKKILLIMLIFPIKPLSMYQYKWVIIFEKLKLLLNP